MESKAIKFFDSIDHLEPKCTNCQTKIDYDVTTTWSDDKNGHVCTTCGTLV